MALASGVLLAGVFAIVLLLATRRRLATAAMIAAAPVTLSVGLTSAGTPPVLAEPTDATLLPNAVLALTGVYLVGLAVATHALFDPRSYR